MKYLNKREKLLFFVGITFSMIQKILFMQAFISMGRVLDLAVEGNIEQLKIEIAYTVLYLLSSWVSSYIDLRDSREYQYKGMDTIRINVLKNYSHFRWQRLRNMNQTTTRVC